MNRGAWKVKALTRKCKHSKSMRKPTLEWKNLQKITIRSQQTSKSLVRYAFDLPWATMRHRSCQKKQNSRSK